jgi:hypothetical protein
MGLTIGQVRVFGSRRATTVSTSDDSEFENSEAVLIIIMASEAELSTSLLASSTA